MCSFGHVADGILDGEPALMCPGERFTSPPLAHQQACMHRRVARRRAVILTWDQDVLEGFWLVREYFPCIRDIDRPRAVAIADIVEALGDSQVIAVPIPHDCVDGFLGAFWRRPEAYLDPRVRSGISSYAAMSPEERDERLSRLAADIHSGAREDQYRNLYDLDELDLGYRLIVA